MSRLKRKDKSKESKRRFSDYKELIYPLFWGKRVFIQVGRAFTPRLTRINKQMKIIHIGPVIQIQIFSATFRFTLKS
tara:strand:+ start:1196 stop:1426 length:231 start_codon:yes stop_codon:yes gene_type:complete